MDLVQIFDTHFILLLVLVLIISIMFIIINRLVNVISVKSAYLRFRRILRKVFLNHKIELKNQRLRLEKQQHEIASQTQSLISLGEELFELNEEKNNVLRILSHDLRHPINQVIGLSHLLLGDKTLTAKQKTDYLNLILDACNHQLKLIENLLDISSIESKTNKPDFQPVDIDVQLTDVIQKHKPAANKKNLNIIYYNTAKISVANADPNYTHRIFENLLSNAIKFSPLGKTITIKTSSENNKLKVSFIDEGPGVAENEVSKLFKKFSRLSARPTAGEHSTGLGLALVKSYTDALNGEAGYQTKHDTGGAHFYVIFEKNAEIGETFKAKMA